MPGPSSAALPLNVTPAATPSRPTPAPSSPSGSNVAPSNSAKPANQASDISSPHELTAFVENLLEQLDAKFEDMSSQILDRMMQMSSRVDALEASIQDIINGDNVAASASASTSSMPQSPTAQRKSSGP